MAKTLSGAFWVTWAGTNAKDSTSLEDLVEPFKTNVKSFIKALTDAGAHVAVGNTLRSAKRAYLFHWCWLIGLNKAQPTDATVMPGVDIEWDHQNPTLSQKGAQEMINGFSLAVPPISINAPSLASNHITGNAVDMTITWTQTINVKKKDGTVAPVLFMSNVDSNLALHAVGASYGVKKLTTDAPHWSVDGH